MVFVSSGKSSVVDTDTFAYVIQGGHMAGGNPADATTYYIGNNHDLDIANATNQARHKIFIPKTGTVTAVYISFINIGNGSNETSTVSFRLNGSTDTTVSSAVTNDSTRTQFNKTDLSVSVTAGEWFEIKWVTPTWSSNPTNVKVYFQVLIEG